jgi:hypothetical protein
MESRELATGRGRDSGAGMGVDRAAIRWRGRALREMQLFMIQMGV